MNNSNDERIAHEESSWNAPKLFMLGFGFLAVCLVVIYVIASI